jgi:hypothetical protein
MAARKLGSLATHSQALEDPRLERSRLHNLLDIVAITICAVICGPIPGSMSRNTDKPSRIGCGDS